MNASNFRDLCWRLFFSRVITRSLHCNWLHVILWLTGKRSNVHFFIVSTVSVMVWHRWLYSFVWCSHDSILMARLFNRMIIETLVVVPTLLCYAQYNVWLSRSQPKLTSMRFGMKSLSLKPCFLKSFWQKLKTSCMFNMGWETVFEQILDGFDVIKPAKTNDRIWDAENLQKSTR